MASLRGLFSRLSFKAAPVPSGVLADSGFINSPLYAGSKIPTYNPDDLLIKQGNTVYKEMLRDEQIKAVYKFRRDAVTARAYQFDFAEDVREALGDTEADRRIALFGKVLGHMKGSFKKKLDGVMSAMAFGFSMTNKVYERIEIDRQQWIGIKHLRTKPPFTFYFYIDEHGNLLRLRQEVNGREAELDINRFIHYARNSDVDEYYGQSELNEAYRGWFSKEITSQYMNIHMERCGSGFNVLKPTEGKGYAKGTAAYQSLLDSLESLRNTTGVILPGDYDLVTTQPKGVDVFRSCIEYHDMAIAKALLVPNLLGLSAQGAHGSFAQSSTQLEAFLWMLDADAVELQEVLNEQLFTELGDLNFGDGMYPTFCLLPLSETQITRTVSTWKDLVSAGAVTATPTDEARIREMMGMPAKAENEDGADTSIVDLQSHALTGIQITSLQGIVDAVVAGQMPKDTARAVIQAAFPILSEDQVNAILDPLDDFEPTPKQVPPGLPGGPQSGGDAPAPSPGGDAPAPEPSGDAPAPAQAAPAAQQEETIRGRKAVKLDYSVATRRVDFVAIARAADTIELKHRYDLAEAMDALVKFADTAITDDGVVDMADITKMKFPADLTAAVRSVSQAVLLDGWNLGEEHAAAEVRAATMRRMPDKNYGALRNKAAKYLELKSFLMAGGLSDTALALVKQVLVNSVKYSKSIEQTRTDIYRAFAKKGMMSPVLAKQILGDTLDVATPDHRLNTVIRTNTFDAVNEARFDFYSDPDLKGYVKGLEYSAVLDDRTTEICSALDGHTHEVGWDGWDRFRPPNHFNCRSILVPLLPNDDWEDSGWPSVEPQEGFG